MRHKIAFDTVKRMPPYFKQESNNTCSLAVLRAVLATHSMNVSEAELILKIEVDYGENFKNIWNPTIAKLARQYGVPTQMVALWPLFKPDVLAAAQKEFRDNPELIDLRRYENPDDDDVLSEPLSLSYIEMFRAVELGCKVIYGSLTAARLKKYIDSGCLVQTSIKTEKLYPKAKESFHSILIYGFDGKIVTYHDPARKSATTCNITQMLHAMNGTGAAIVYTKSYD